MCLAILLSLSFSVCAFCHLLSAQLSLSGSLSVCLFISLSILICTLWRIESVWSRSSGGAAQGALRGHLCLSVRLPARGLVSGRSLSLTVCVPFLLSLYVSLCLPVAFCLPLRLSVCLPLSHARWGGAMTQQPLIWAGGSFPEREQRRAGGGSVSKRIDAG